MVATKSYNDIVLGLLDWLKNAQPNLDTKPGTVSRDLFVDGISSQVSRLYEEVNKVSTLQSLRLATGSDLDKLAKNFGAFRKKGAKATVPALLTFNSLDVDIAITKGDTVTAKNGSTFAVMNSQVISPVLATNYQAIVAKNRADLDFVGITDTYAVEVLLEATAIGNQGNISKYSLSNTNISGINNVINVVSGGGGKSAEDDASFRIRILSIFSGSNTGTSLGYESAAKGDPSVIDAVVIEPGDDLMVRDGTQVSVAADGTRTIVSEGTGGKVDILIFGSRLQEALDSFIYRDLSNTNDPTNNKNDFVLGQVAGDENKTITRKRLDNLKTKILPTQPINNLVSVTGSSSGPNFIEKNVDELGRVSGNFELLKDTGVFSGSCWGLDKLHWISSFISNFPEDKTKNSFNGQDSLSFSDVLRINSIQQNIIITNENSRVLASDRSNIQLAHFPVTSVTRVFNVTTGERYVISNQNPDGSGNINLTGKIIISGRSLPSTSDILQVDYTWIFSYDPYFDFDSKLFNDNLRSSKDSIDWGYSNLVKAEQVVLNTSGSFITAEVTHNISAIVSVNVFSSEESIVFLSSGRYAVTVDNSVENIIRIVDSNGIDLWNTATSDGTFSGFVVFLPTDISTDLGETVTVFYNAIDVFNGDTTGNFNNNIISIVPSDDAVAGAVVECNYIANISTILSATSLNNLPAIRNENKFNVNNSSSIGNQPTSHIYNGSEILQNLRLGPSNLALNIVGNISPGVMTITGTSISYLADIVFIATNNGLKQDISSAIRKFLKLNSKTSISELYQLVRVTKFEKVITNSNLDVLESLYEYDLRGYRLLNNSFVKNEAIKDSELTSFEVQLPSTTNNQNNNIEIGDKIRIRAYISKTSDSENIYFSKSGSLYSNKKYLLVDSIYISSGFISSVSGTCTLTVTNMNQPNTKSRYKSYYDYLAPKTNERITVSFNYDKIIQDTTLSIESTRPINADVLVKAATAILVDVTLNIVVSEEFKNNSNIVKQNVQDVISSALQAQSLGTIIDSSDLVQVAYTVSGVDRVRVMFFNKSNSSGSVNSIVAQKNEYIFPNNVTVNIESR